MPRSFSGGRGIARAPAAPNGPGGGTLATVRGKWVSYPLGEMGVSCAARAKYPRCRTPSIAAFGRFFGGIKKSATIPRSVPPVAPSPAIFAHLNLSAQVGCQPPCLWFEHRSAPHLFHRSPVMLNERLAVHAHCRRRLREVPLAFAKKLNGLCLPGRHRLGRFAALSSRLGRPSPRLSSGHGRNTPRLFAPCPDIL